MEKKKIICLANSRKYGGRCIAGKEIRSRNWIRPIRDGGNGELRVSNLKYKCGKYQTY